VIVYSRQRSARVCRRECHAPFPVERSELQTCIGQSDAGTEAAPSPCVNGVNTLMEIIVSLQLLSEVK
jgi:hypothetical protein